MASLHRNTRILVYAENDLINSKTGRELAEKYKKSGQLMFRNPSFYGVTLDENKQLVGEVERFGVGNEPPEYVLIAKGSKNAEIITKSYERAGSEVSEIELAPDKPTGSLESSPTGDLAAFLRGELKRAVAESAGEQKPADESGGKGGKIGGK